MVPPVARAVIIMSTRLLMESTSETPDTAASPTRATIMVSAVPIRAVNSCSTISGINSMARSFLENSLPFSCSTMSSSFRAVCANDNRSSTQKKDTQTGDQPVCVPYQEEGEMKKNCYGYIVHDGYYRSHRTFVSFS